MFTANGGYQSGQHFMDGMSPAVFLGAALVGVSAIAAFAINSSSRTERFELGTGVPLLAACACASCWCAPPGDCLDTEEQVKPPTQIPILVGV